MDWLALVAIAVVFDAFRIFTDNYISDVYYKGREVAAQKLFSAYGKTIVSIIILLIVGFSFSDFTPQAIVTFLFAGVLLSLAEIPYYLALGIDDSTNIGIFIQLTPVLYLILGWLFLGDTFSPIQLIAIAIILIAPILIVATSRKRSRKTKLRAVMLALIYVLISVIGNLIFVKTNGEELDMHIIVEEITLVILGTGLTDALTMLCLPKWRKRYHHVIKKSKGKVRIPLAISMFIGIIKSFAYRAALVVAPAVALASAASDSVEPIVIFFIGIVLTLIWPQFGREKLDKKTVLVHLAATILVVVGIILMKL